MGDGNKAEIIAAADGVTVWGARDGAALVVTVAGPDDSYRSVRTSRSIEYVLWALERDLPSVLRPRVEGWLARHGAEHADLRVTT